MTIHEAGHYPRHRVCGEFICGRGLDSLRRLGLFEKILPNSRAARTVRFVSRCAASRVLTLPRSALCISRFLLDDFLAREFRQLDGDLRENKRVRGPSAIEGVVCASGRRLHSAAAGRRWIGLKVHAHQVPLRTDLELHLANGGYVGLCRLNQDATNICGLFRYRTSGSAVIESWRTYLGGEPNSELERYRAEAILDESSFCSVTGLSYTRRDEGKAGGCALGDAFSMIAPFTGNGMSMAFEAAELAIDPLVQYSLGRMTWSQAQQSIVRGCTNAFRTRVSLASWLQRAMLDACLASWLIRITHCFPRVFSVLFSHTR